MPNPPVPAEAKECTMLSKEVKHMIHPRSVGTIKFEGKDIDDTTQKSVTNYFALYFICILGIFLAISFEPFDIETNLTAVVTCFNNVGPGLSAVGPMGSFSDYSYASKDRKSVV